MSDRYAHYIIVDGDVLERHWGGPGYERLSPYAKDSLVEWANKGREMVAEKNAEAEKARKRAARLKKKAATE